jgi:4a-hydroxytetrahydrobiopterin dehydratase
MPSRRSTGTSRLESGWKTHSRTSSRPALRDSDATRRRADGLWPEVVTTAIVDTEVVTPAGWSEVDGALERTFELASFPEAIAFVGRVAELAEVENHHPDIAVHYRRVTLRWWTHTAGGITERDRELAKASSALA